MCYRVTILRWGIKRIVICLPTEFYRLYSIVLMSIISNLLAMLFLSLYKGYTSIRIYITNKNIQLPHLKSGYLQFHLWSQPNCCCHLQATHYLLLADTEVILLFVSWLRLHAPNVYHDTWRRYLWQFLFLDPCIIHFFLLYKHSLHTTCFFPLRT